MSANAVYKAIRKAKTQPEPYRGPPLVGTQMHVFEVYRQDSGYFTRVGIVTAPTSAGAFQRAKELRLCRAPALKWKGVL